MSINLVAAGALATAEPTLFEKISQHIVHAIYFDGMRYIIAVGFFFAIITVFKTYASKRRVQKRTAQKKDYVREIASSIRTVFIFALTTISTILLTEAGMVNIQLDSVGAGILLAQIAAIILAHDTYFYWMHRALHHKRLFRATHLHHHKSRTPTAFAAYSFSVWEAASEAAFVPIFLLITSLLGVSYAGFAIFIFLGFMIIRNVMGHLGVEMHPAGWVDNKWTDWINTTTHHDLHHSSGNHNFGLYFTWWDRMMGTEHPAYRQRFREVSQPIFAKPVSVSPRLAEKVAVALMAAFATSTALGGGLSVMGV